MRLAIGDLVSPAFSAKKISAELKGKGFSQLEMTVGEVRIQERVWRNLRLLCPRFALTSSELRCPSGTLEAGAPVAVSFSYAFPGRALDATLRPAPSESWRLSGTLGPKAWKLDLAVEQGSLARLAAWLPLALPKLSGGTVDGKVALAGAGGTEAQAYAQLAVRDLAFSDSPGLHAGEAIAATLSVSAQRTGDRWLWQGALDWPQGQVFWQPLYLKGGLSLKARGALDSGIIEVEEARLKLAQVGEARIAGTLDRATQRLRDLSLKAQGVELSGLYREVLKPFLDETAFSDLHVEGIGSLSLDYRKGILNRLDLELKNAKVEDRQRRFAFSKVNARIPWGAGENTIGRLSFERGEFFRVPLGETSVRAEIGGNAISIPELTVPVLDGALTLHDLRASKEGKGWSWTFSGGLSAVSMERLTQAVGIVPMHGTLSAVIPKVSYSQSTLQVGGALLFKVFDGTVVVRNLVMADPLGRVPRVEADVDMRNLDLGLLTRTFSFGNITGRIDATVRGLELTDWQPVAFDARVGNSPGNYPKRISQKAVQNLSALGGAGAAGAIQRSFLRFFKEFGYSKIGLSCTLHDGVCQMGGIENAPNGYVIVKGGGIPAITVIGYNRQVGWQELINRLKRITQENVKPVIE